MKKHDLLMAVCAMLLVFGACGNGQKPETKEDGSETPQGTTQVNAESTISDLAFFDLQGPVKSCDGVVFDRAGRVVTVDGIDPFSIDGPYRDIDSTGEFAEYCQWSRDDQGNIACLYCVESINNYEWENGRVVGENGSGEGIDWVVKYQFNPEGRVIKLFTYYVNEEGTQELHMETHFEYLKFDDHGNWIQRNMKYYDVQIGYNYEDVSTRSIEYYE